MIPDFHDGFVDGVLVSGLRAKLFLRKIDGQKFTLALHGIERLHVENFREGNIIFSLDFLELEQLTLEHVCQAYQYNEHTLASFIMKDWVEDAKQRGLKAVEISASYGCSALILFKSFELTEGFAL
jgi:hypothetical protein